jgi:hypothetical protein
MRVSQCVSLTIALSIASAAGAQTTGEPKVTVGLVDAIAPATWEIRVPVEVTVAPGTSVARVSFQVLYPAKILEYQRTEAAEMLQAAGIELKAQPPQTKSDPASVEIEIAANAKLKTLPSGRLGNVVFKIADAAEEGESAVKAAQVKAWGPTPSAALGAAAGPDGKLTVAPPGLPIFACFYYMH